MAQKSVDPAAKARMSKVVRALKKAYPDAKCSLNFENEFQLLVATILSAQCTDARVNKVTPALFDAYPTPAAMAQAEPGDIESLIRSTGFYVNKEKSLLALAI